MLHPHENRIAAMESVLRDINCRRIRMPSQGRTGGARAARVGLRPPGWLFGIGASLSGTGTGYCHMFSRSSVQVGAGATRCSGVSK